MNDTKLDLRVALDFIKRDFDGPSLQIETNNEVYFVSKFDKIFFGNQKFVIDTFPKISLGFDEVEKIKIMYSSDLITEYKDIFDNLVDAVNKKLNLEFYIEFNDLDYIDLKLQTIKEINNDSSNNILNIKFNDEDFSIKYEEIKKVEFTIAMEL